MYWIGITNIIAMSINSPNSTHSVYQKISVIKDIASFKAEMEALGYDEETINEKIKESKKQKLASRQSNGFICLATGATLGFISCLLTVLNPIPEIYYWVLYGLTSTAILIICLGLYFVFEE